MIGSEIGIDLLGELEKIIGCIYRRRCLGQQCGGFFILEAEIRTDKALQ